jgi:hypothetical protein
MVMNTYENQPMTEQLTKYTKTVVFSDDNNNISSHHNKNFEKGVTELDLKKATHSNRQGSNNYLIKTTSRGSSNMTGISNGLTSAIGTPLSLANANNNLPKPVLISTFNSNKFNPNLNSNVHNSNSNINISESHGSNLNSFKNENSLLKNDRIKSSQLTRSVTMKYTKSHFDNTNTFTGNTNQQLLNLGNGLSAANVSNGNINGSVNASTSSGLNYLYGQNRKTANPTSLQQQLLQNQKQQQLIIDLTNPKKEYYNSLHRSTSISLGREKSSLSNYFSTVNSNKYFFRS